MADIEAHLKNVQDALLTADRVMTTQSAEISRLREALSSETAAREKAESLHKHDRQMWDATRRRAENVEGELAAARTLIKQKLILIERHVARAEAAEALVSQHETNLDALQSDARSDRELLIEANAKRRAAEEALRELRMQMLSDEGQKREISPAPVDLMERVEKALEAFAEALDGADDDKAGDGANIWEAPVAMSITYGDLRAAAEVLTDLREARGKG